MPFSHSFTFTPPKRFGSGIGAWESVRIEESSADVTFAAVETLPLDGVQVAPSGFDTDPSAPQTRGITTDAATLETGYFRVIWIDGDGDESPASESVFSPGGSFGVFATTDDLATRLGRELTAEEEANGEAVIALVTGLITEIAGQNAAWAEALDPVPAYFKALCVEKAVALITNPGLGVIAGETLGAWSVTYARGATDIGAYLSDHEQRMVFRIANNAVSGSTRTKSLVHDVYVTEPE